MADLHLLAALLGGLVLVLSLATGLLKGHGYLLSEEIVALLFGIVLGQNGLDVLLLRPWVRPLDRPAATLFVGWFGPIGIAAVLYATLSVRHAGTELPWILGSLAVTGRSSSTG